MLWLHQLSPTFCVYFFAVFCFISVSSPHHATKSCTSCNTFLPVTKHCLLGISQLTNKSYYFLSKTVAMWLHPDASGILLCHQKPAILLCHSSPAIAFQCNMYFPHAALVETAHQLSPSLVLRLLASKVLSHLSASQVKHHHAHHTPTHSLTEQWLFWV